MNIRIRFFGRFRNEIGKKEVTWAMALNTRLLDILKSLQDNSHLKLKPEYIKENYSPRRALIILLDGVELHAIGDSRIKLWNHVEID